MKKNTLIGILSLFIYGLSIFLANWCNRNVGPIVIPGGTHLTPVGFGLLTPSGVYAAGATFVARDIAQRTVGKKWSFLVVPLGALFSGFLDVHLALASGIAFFASETSDFLIYTSLQRRFVRAVFLSAAVSSVVDSLVFLSIAGFFSPTVFAGQLLGKLYVVFFGAGISYLLRRFVLAPAPKALRLAA